MRAREKVGEIWRLRDAEGKVLDEGHECADASGCILSDEDRADGVKLYRVHVYRLAPLIELPAWTSRADGSVQMSWQRGSGDWIEAITWHGKSPSKPWRASVCQDEDTGHLTADEARAACEARLRELGYRVAKAGAL